MSIEVRPEGAENSGYGTRKIVPWAIILALSTGIVLRTIQYLAASSLWFDELAIALNIRDRSLTELLTQPLDLLQAAPTAFILAVKASTGVLGVNEIGLRAVPWACGILGLVLFWRLASKLMDGPALLAVLALFASSPALIWYAGNLKQYSGDVAMTLLLVLLAWGLMEKPVRRRPVLHGVIGGSAILLSQPALLTAAVLGFILIALESAGRRQEPQSPAPFDRSLAGTLMIWGVAAAVGTVTAFVTTGPETRTYMRRFWEPAFLPSLWDPISFLQDLGAGFYDVFAHFLIGYADQTLAWNRVIVIGPLLVALVGLIWLLRSRSGMVLLLLAPVASAIAASSFRLLPLQDRIVLSLGWPLLLLAGCGVFAIQLWRRWAGVLAALAVAGLLPVVVLGGSRPPYRAEETRPVLQRLSTMIEDGDRIYAYYGARHALSYYGTEVGLGAWTQGSCHRRDARGYFRELDSFRGESRVWIVMAHAHPGYREAEMILSYLDSIGVRVAEIDDGYGLEGQRDSFAVLFDLSQPGRLDSTDWQTHPIPAIDLRGLRDCDGRLHGTGEPSAGPIP